jgi:hypothetical protein
MVTALLLGALAMSTACAKRQSSNANTAAGSMMGMAAANHSHMGPATMGTLGVGDSCPAAVPGTTAQATDTADGIVMTFTGDVLELRKQARAMADRMNERADAVPATRTRVQDVPGGTRIVMAPADPSKAEDWRRRMWKGVLDMIEGRACSTLTST